MAHNRREVIWRAMKEYELLDKLVASLSEADWKRRVPRSESKDPWTIKDVLAHITYWKSCVALSARGQRRPKEANMNITEGNRAVYLRWRRRSPKEVLQYHRQVQIELLAALREAPTAWFTRKSRSKDWPFDLDGHSANHRLNDIQRALKPDKN